MGVPFSSIEGLQVRSHPAVGSNAVHPRRLRVEAAHRDLAADCAGAGHAWSSEDGGSGGEPGRGPNGAVEYTAGLGRASRLLGRPPGPAPRGGRRPRANRNDPGRSLVTRAPSSTSSGRGPRLLRRDRVCLAPARAAARSPGFRAAGHRGPACGRAVDRARPDGRVRRPDRRGRAAGRFGGALRHPAGARARGGPATIHVDGLGSDPRVAPPRDPGPERQPRPTTWPTAARTSPDGPSGLRRRRTPRGVPSGGRQPRGSRR